MNATGPKGFIPLPGAAKRAYEKFKQLEQRPMTKTTEEMKRVMYSWLAQVKMLDQGGGYQLNSAADLENALEEYLEALRQESIAKDVRIDHLERMGDVMRDGYMYQQQLNQQARAEADRERNRAQAFEFANKSAGELLIDSRAKVKAQRQSIGKLKNERDNALHTVKVRTSQRDGLEAQLASVRTELSETRKLLGSTITQNRRESVAGDECGAVPDVIDADYIDRTIGKFIESWERSIGVINVETK